MKVAAFCWLRLVLFLRFQPSLSFSKSENVGCASFRKYALPSGSILKCIKPAKFKALTLWIFNSSTNPTRRRFCQVLMRIGTEQIVLYFLPAFFLTEAKCPYHITHQRIHNSEQAPNLQRGCQDFKECILFWVQKLSNNFTSVNLFCHIQTLSWESRCVLLFPFTDLLNSYKRKNY